MNIPGLIIIVLLCVMDGLVIYGVYADCDIGTYGRKFVTSNDQVGVVLIYSIFTILYRHYEHLPVGRSNIFDI